MGVPKKRMSKSRRDKRRSHNNKLKVAVQTNACPTCGAAIMPHRACPACGQYRGRKVIEGTAD